MSIKESQIVLNLCYVVSELVFLLFAITFNESLEMSKIVRKKDRNFENSRGGGEEEVIMKMGMGGRGCDLENFIEMVRKGERQGKWK